MAQQLRLGEDALAEIHGLESGQFIGAELGGVHHGQLPELGVLGQLNLAGEDGVDHHHGAGPGEQGPLPPAEDGGVGQGDYKGGQKGKQADVAHRRHGSQALQKGLELPGCNRFGQEPAQSPEDPCRQRPGGDLFQGSQTASLPFLTYLFYFLNLHRKVKPIKPMILSNYK